MRPKKSAKTYTKTKNRTSSLWLDT